MKMPLIWLLFLHVSDILMFIFGFNVLTFSLATYVIFVLMAFTCFSPLLPKSKVPPASPLSPLSFPHCLQAPVQRLEQYCEALEELGGLNPACDSALSILRHAQRHGEDLRASDLIVGCPVRKPVPVCHPADSSVRRRGLLVFI